MRGRAREKPRRRGGREGRSTAVCRLCASHPVQGRPHHTSCRRPLCAQDGPADGAHDGARPLGGPQARRQQGARADRRRRRPCSPLHGARPRLCGARARVGPQPALRARDVSPRLRSNHPPARVVLALPHVVCSFGDTISSAPHP
eukprot:3001739-Prymnesium_polylepis.2